MYSSDAFSMPLKCNKFHFKWAFAPGPFEGTLQVLYLTPEKPLCSIRREGKHRVVRTGNKEKERDRRKRNREGKLEKVNKTGESETKKEFTPKFGV